MSLLCSKSIVSIFVRVARSLSFRATLSLSFARLPIVFPILFCVVLLLYCISSYVCIFLSLFCFFIILTEFCATIHVSQLCFTRFYSLIAFLVSEKRKRLRNTSYTESNRAKEREEEAKV